MLCFHDNNRTQQLFLEFWLTVGVFNDVGVWSPFHKMQCPGLREGTELCYLTFCGHPSQGPLAREGNLLIVVECIEESEKLVMMAS